MNKTTRKHWAKCTTGGGFTLAELLIVVAVIAVLVAVAIPTFGGQLEKSRQASDVANLRDAYAMAKIALIGQHDKDGLLYADRAANTIADSPTSAYYYFDYKNEALVKSKDDVAGYGQSTASVVIDVDKIPSGIAFGGKAKDKVIAVTFIWSATKGEYESVNMAFEDDEAAKGTITVSEKANATALTVASKKYTATFANGVDVTFTEFNGDEGTGTAVYALGTGSITYYSDTKATTAVTPTFAENGDPALDENATKVEFTVADSFDTTIKAIKVPLKVTADGYNPKEETITFVAGD